MATKKKTTQRPVRYPTIAAVLAEPTVPEHNGLVAVPLAPGWDYTIVPLGNTLERQISQLQTFGALGWELVSVLMPAPPQGGLSLAYMKRPGKGTP